MKKYEEEVCEIEEVADSFVFVSLIVTHTNNCRRIIKSWGRPTVENML